MKPLAPALALLLLLAACGGSDSQTVLVAGPPPTDPGRVGPADIGTLWHLGDTRDGGTVLIQAGAPVPPLFGEGCLHLTTTDTLGGSSQAKAQLVTYGYAGDGVPGAGVRLDQMSDLGYWAFRSASSTNPAVQMVALNIEVDFVGDGSSYTTLVYEPVYNLDQQDQQSGAWQFWDALREGDGVWWSTKDIPGVLAFNEFVPWSAIIASNPDAVIVGALGFTCGSGWVGDFQGAADGLIVEIDGEGTTYDFEP